MTASWRKVSVPCEVVMRHGQLSLQAIFLIDLREAASFSHYSNFLLKCEVGCNVFEQVCAFITKIKNKTNF